MVRIDQAAQGVRCTTEEHTECAQRPCLYRPPEPIVPRQRCFNKLERSWCNLKWKSCIPCSNDGTYRPAV